MARRLPLPLLAVIAIPAFLTASLPSCGDLATAGGATCRAKCKAAYGRCYQSSGGDRQKCDRQLRNCLEGCLKRSSVM